MTFYDDRLRNSSDINVIASTILGARSVGVADGKDAVEMVSGGMISIPSLVAIGSGIEVTLRALPQQYEGLQCRYN
jgi:hypothetical protein